jgi:hypothetical protein
MSERRGDTAALLLAAALACGDGGDGERAMDCTPTLEQWCEREGCDGMWTVAEALASAGPDAGIFAGYGECDEQITITTSDGDRWLTYGYDAQSGELVAAVGANVFGMSGQAECAEVRAGESVASCEMCHLYGFPSHSDLTPTLCPGELGQRLLDACLADPPEPFADCAECACAACQPALACPGYTEDFGSGSFCVFGGARCVAQHCRDECAVFERIEASD